MADPGTMGAISIGSSVIGSVLGAEGARESAEATARSYEYKAALALMNKRINLQNATWSREAGETNAMRSGFKSRQEIGGTKVAQSASGFDLNTGSAEAVRETQGEVAKFDQDMIRYDASKTAYGYEMKAKANEMEANAMLSAAQSARSAGRRSVAASILGGATSVAGKWSQGQQAGLWGGSSGGQSTLAHEEDYATG